MTENSINSKVSKLMDELNCISKELAVSSEKFKSHETVLQDIKDSKKANRALIITLIIFCLGVIVSVSTCSYNREISYANFELKRQQDEKARKDNDVLNTDEHRFLNNEIKCLKNSVDSLCYKQRIYFDQEYRDNKKRLSNYRGGCDSFDTVIIKINPNIPFSIYDSIPY
jgi:hypothetical protein